MANVKSGNTWYIDSTGDLDGSISYTALNVHHIVVTSTGSAGTITLQDAATNVNKISLAVEANKTLHIPLRDNPIAFSGGIGVSALSNCTASIVYTKQSG